MAEFKKVLNRNELAEGQGRCVELEGVRLAIYRAAGAFYAVADTCTHEEASLSEGRVVDEYYVECPLHGARFDLRTGQVRSLPATQPVQTYPVRVQGDDVEVQFG